jgi:hypothetical protein
MTDTGRLLSRRSPPSVSALLQGVPEDGQDASGQIVPNGSAPMVPRLASERRAATDLRLRMTAFGIGRPVPR